MIKPSLDDLRSLSQRSLPVEPFCQEFLESLAELVGADAGIIWDASSSAFKVKAQYSANDQPARLNLKREEHDRLLIQAAMQESPIAIRPDRNQENTPNTPQVNAAPILLMGRFHRSGRHLIELMISPAPEEPVAMKAMQDFQKALELANQPETEPEMADPSVSHPDALQQSMAQLDGDRLSEFATAIHRDIDLKMACANVANESRRLLDCDRVSVLIKYRGHFRLFAISGQPSVNRRSNTSKRLERIGRRVLDAKSELWYPEETELASPVQNALSDYLSIAATRSMVVLPVFEQTAQLVEDPDSLESDRTDSVIAGLVFEHCNQRWDRDSVETSLRRVAEHGSNAIRNAHAHQRLFLYPVWKWLGKSRLLTAPRMLPKTLLVALAATILTLVLAFLPVDFYVSADGELIPQRLVPVTSKLDGEVVQLSTEHGSLVKQGQPLLTIESKDLDLQIKDLEGQLAGVQQRLDAIQQRRFDDTDEDEEIEENVVSLKSQVTNIQQRLKILHQMESSGEVFSPIDGRVITWDLERRLKGRSIQRGVELLEVADIDGPWEVEIYLPVRRLQHLDRAIQELNKSDLRVSMLLAADTSRRLEGKIIEIERSVGLTPDREQVIRVRASIDAQSNLSIDQARTGVTAKIYCGRSSLGYLWLHDIGEFFTKYVLFPLK